MRCWLISPVSPQSSPQTSVLCPVRLRWLQRLRRKRSQPDTPGRREGLVPALALYGMASRVPRPARRIARGRPRQRASKQHLQPVDAFTSPGLGGLGGVGPRQHGIPPRQWAEIRFLAGYAGPCRPTSQRAWAIGARTCGRATSLGAIARGAIGTQPRGRTSPMRSTSRGAFEDLFPPARKPPAPLHDLPSLASPVLTATTQVHSFGATTAPGLFPATQSLVDPVRRPGAADGHGRIACGRRIRTPRAR